MNEETCVVCGDDLKVGIITIANEVSFNLCVWCHEDKESFRQWLENEMRNAVENSPEFEKMSDGRYRRKSL